jgi:predicted aldo/keto reductase-like oxidoreductase
MQHRPYGITGLHLSVLGFGAMRLPSEKVDDKWRLRLDESVALLRRGLELGITYVDTAYTYGFSQSEIAVGLALRDGWREKVVLSSKSPIAQMTARGDFRRILEEQLTRLGTDYIDIYHFHGLSRQRNEAIVRPLGLVEEMQRAKDEGLIRHIATSMHDTPEEMLRIIDEGWAEGILVQYNLLDRVNAPVLTHARAKGLGTVAMGPVGAGRLGETSAALLRLLPPGVDALPELALRFACGNPDLTCAISGMGNPAMLEANVAAAELPPLTDADLTHADSVLADLRAAAAHRCTLCGQCLPCPAGVEIVRCLEQHINADIYGVRTYARSRYAKLVRGEHDAARCTDCGDCEPRCPQGVEIRRRLRETATALG